MLHGLDDPNVGIRRAISEWPGDNGNGPCLSVLDDADDREILFESSAPMSAEQQGRQPLAAQVEHFPRIQWFHAYHDVGQQERNSLYS